MRVFCGEYFVVHWENANKQIKENKLFAVR